MGFRENLITGFIIVSLIVLAACAFGLGFGGGLSDPIKWALLGPALGCALLFLVVLVIFLSLIAQ